MVRTVLIAAVLATACAAQEPSVSDRHSPPFPAERDPQIAAQEEFDAALKASTVEAWDLFIRRHPDNPLTEAARAERAKLAGER